MRMLLLTTGVICGLSGAALAQYSGPSEGRFHDGNTYRETSLGDIIANPEDGMHVTLEGTLIRKTGDEMYVFSDGTDEINVEIDDDDFPNRDVSETTRVRIDGEVDTHRTRDTDIDADRVEIVQ